MRYTVKFAVKIEVAKQICVSYIFNCVYRCYATYYG